MKLTMPARSAAALGCVAITVRALFAVSVDGQNIGNAGWISLLTGALVCVPFAALLSKFASTAGGDPMKATRGTLAAPLCAVYGVYMALVMTYEASTMTYIITETVANATFGETPLIALYAPTLIAAGIACLFGGVASGGLAQIWIRLFPWLFVFVIAAQFSHFRPEWIAPILGYGITPLANGALTAAGSCAAIAALWMLTEGGPRAKRHGSASVAAAIAILATVLILLQAMMTPNMPDAPNTRAFAVKRIIANGRIASSMQLPLTLLWFTSLLTALIFALNAGANYIKLAFDKLDPKLCVLISLLACIAYSVSNVSNRAALSVIAPWRFAIIALPTAAIAAAGIIGNRRKNA